MRILFRALTVFVLVAMAAPLNAQEEGLEQKDVLAYLEQLVAWHRSANAIEPAGYNARELIFRDSLRQHSLHVLQSGFKFAKSQASHQSEPAVAETDESQEQTPRQRMLERLNQANAEVDALNLQLQKSKTADRARLQDQLKLALAKQGLYQAVLANMVAAESGESRGFLGKINNLMRAIPELSAVGQKAKEKETAAADSVPPATVALQPRTVTSLLSLMSDSFTITRKQRELNDFLQETSNLESTSRQLLSGLKDQLDQLTQTQSSNAGASVKPLTVDEKLAIYHQIGGDILPLGDATLWLRISKRTAQDWREVLEQQLQGLLRQLAVHAAILAFTIAIPLAISEAIRRAINRYVGDPKRKRQAQTARRILAGLIILFIILLNFISDFSSFATFAGFLTAGLAVALQSVLLSFIGHFFFYGRYGVRKGDRVTVAGVTGDILQIGIMRFYVSELAHTEQGLQPTGKIVTFPNSILFQPSGFYKYVD